MDTYSVGDTIHIGTEVQARRSYDDGFVSYLMTDDGRMIKPQYFPIHTGQPGRNPAFPVEAAHVGTCVAVDDDGLTHMRCTCGAEWSFKPGSIWTA